MSEYIVNFGDTSSAFVGLAMAEVKYHGASIGEQIVRCRDCKDYRASDQTCHSWQWHNWDAALEVWPDGYCAWGERKEGVE